MNQQLEQEIVLNSSDKHSNEQTSIPTIIRLKEFNMLLHKINDDATEKLGIFIILVMYWSISEFY